MYWKNDKIHDLISPACLLKLSCRDDTVEVGSDLYQIDTDVTAAVTAVPTISGTLPGVAAATPTTAIPVQHGNTSHRTPSIHFLGKAGWAARKSPATEEAIESKTTVQDIYQQLEAVQLVPDDPTWDPMYGRPPISDDEIESLVMGVASGAPQLLKPSSGATFG